MAKVPWSEKPVAFAPAIKKSLFEAKSKKGLPFTIDLEKYGTRPRGVITITKAVAVKDSD